MSFNNVSDSQAIEAMTKAMYGETESMKMLGVNLSETIMAQSEYVKSTGKSWKEMTLAEKATARYHEALKQSPNAFGDAERTAMSFTNQVKAMKGNFQEFIKSEGRYKSLKKTNPSEAEALYEKAEKDAATRMSVFKAVGELLK